MVEATMCVNYHQQRVPPLAGACQEAPHYKNCTLSHQMGTSRKEEARTAQDELAAESEDGPQARQQTLEQHQQTG